MFINIPDSFIAFRIVRTGDRYGHNGMLTHNEPRPMVEFYDTRFDFERWTGCRGQFVSRYYAETLASVDGGLCLDGGIPEWSVDAIGMAFVRETIKGEL